MPECTFEGEPETKRFDKDKEVARKDISLLSHPQPHFRRAVGQRDMVVGSLSRIVGLTQAINLRCLQALPFRGELQP